MGIETEINRHVQNGFRRAYIKRRDATTGLYETNWYNITSYIKKWGTIDRAIDDQKLNTFNHSGITLTVRNDTGAFNPESNVSSLWSGYMTRYRTLLKIEGGYTTDSGAELPTDTTLGVFILNDEIPISGVNNTTSIRARSLISIFDEVRTPEISGIYATLTASEIIAKIRDHTDGSGNFYFRQFITSTAWTIQATTNYYNPTTTVLGSMSCWDFMQRLAESEGFVLMINRSGGLEFRNRSERASTSALSFRGLGFNKMNVIALNEYKEAYNKLFTFFRMKYLEADTSTSFVTAGSTSTVDPSATTWKYGSRKYEMENTFVNNTTAAQNIVNNLHTEFSQLKNELKLTTKFVPQLEILDRVDVSYRSYELAGTTLWDRFNWDEANWALVTGENFDFTNVGFKILSVGIDLETMRNTFVLREV